MDLHDNRFKRLFEESGQCVFGSVDTERQSMIRERKHHLRKSMLCFLSGNIERIRSPRRAGRSLLVGIVLLAIGALFHPPAAFAQAIPQAQRGFYPGPVYTVDQTEAI